MSAAKPPYRSKKRDETEVRRLEAHRLLLQAHADRVFGGPSYVPPVLPLGTIVFDESGRRLTKILNTAIRHNRRELNCLHGKEFRRLVRCIDDLWIITSRYTMTPYIWPEVRPSPMHEVLFSCLYKSILSLYACHLLTTEGLYNLGRPHLRHVFESLIIAKFCAVNPSSNVYDKWADGVELYITNDILKKIAHPPIDGFTKLWRFLCQVSHATVFAGQAGLSLEETREGALANISLSWIFVQWMYHLIQHMLTPTVRYYGDRYATTKEAEKARIRLRKCFQLHSKHLPPESLALIKRFRAKWELR